jgi:UDPglucose--hexose-1-phosphate uridylyltransferase
MSEMRWNPVLREWLVTATHRQDRTFLPPAGFCPLCPTQAGGFPTEVEQESFEFVVFENKFPSLAREPIAPSVESSDLYPVVQSQGVCEVVLYTQEHTLTLAELPEEKLEQLIQVWKDRYIDLGSKSEIEYVFIFENKGEAIGVTIHHPHGQIYAFPFVPPKVQREIDSEEEHFTRTGHCLHCDIVNHELSQKDRLVAENDQFVAFVPFYARYPYEVNIYARGHVPSMAQFDEALQRSLASILKTVLVKYDNLWGFSLPYMMVMHQAPTNGKHYPGSHFHIEFYPPFRTREKIKYLAGCESGAGTFVNDTLPEEKAAELRQSSPNTEHLKQ